MTTTTQAPSHADYVAALARRDAEGWKPVGTPMPIRGYHGISLQHPGGYVPGTGRVPSGARHDIYCGCSRIAICDECNNDGEPCGACGYELSTPAHLL